MEQLEDRSVPATFLVNTTLDVVDPGDGKRTLREAITAANARAGADVIVLQAGVYKNVHFGTGENGNNSGDFDLTDSVTIQGLGAGKTIVDGQKLDRVFDVIGTAPSSIRVVLEKLTVRGGNAVGHGGGIQVGNADLVVRHAAVTGNRSSIAGGGIAVPDGTSVVKLVGAAVVRNAAGGNGGGVFALGAASELIALDSIVRHNRAGSGGGVYATKATLTRCTVGGNFSTGFGGGVRAVESATLTACTVSGNAAGTGGGVFSTGPTVLTSCTVSGNVSPSGDGGGIWASSATLSNTTVSGNTASTDGGGVHATTAALTNCTISGNSAGATGGGMLAVAATILNCTVVENSAQSGGGLFQNSGGIFSLRNTIVALNLVDFAGSGPDISGNFTSQGHNLIGDFTGGTGFTNGVNGDLLGTVLNPIDPKLGPLASNGGRTKTHALKAGSRAIDAGDNVGALAVDQRGLPRRKDGNFDGIATVDIGAFER